MNRFLLLLVLSALPGFAQDVVNKPNTKLDAFADQRGVVVIKGYTRMGTINANTGGTLTIEAEDFKNAATGARRQGLAFIVEESATKRCTSYVDDEEIAPMIQGLETLAGMDGHATPLSLFRATYRTQGDLAFTVVNSRNPKDLKLSVISGTETGTPCRVLVDLPAMDEIISDVKEAQKLLESVR